MEVLKNISESLQRGDQHAVAELTRQAIDSGLRDVINLIRRRDPDSRIRIITGGAPLLQDFADEIGADGSSYDAGSAVVSVKRLMGAA